MRIFLMLLMLISGIAIVQGCQSTAQNVKTPADTQPRGYMDDMNNSLPQRSFESGGAIRN